MLKVLYKPALLLMLAFAFAGCTHTSVKGGKLAELDSPVKKLSYTFNSGQASKAGLGSSVINETMNDLAKLLSQRMPLVFSMNGVETAMPEASQYHLVVTPFYGTYQQYGGHVGIDMRATLIDRTRFGAKIWEGNIHFHRPGLASVDEKAADSFSRSVLEKLAADGVVRLEAGEMKMPEEKAK